MTRVTRVQFEELRRTLQHDGQECECPIWTEWPAKTLQDNDIANPKWFWSLRAGGLFMIPAGIQIPNSHVPDEVTRTRISSWIWEQNSVFEKLGTNEEEETPELTPEFIKLLGERKPLPVEQRIDRVLRMIGRPPKGLEAKSKQITETQALFMAATECGKRVEMRWLLRQIQVAGLLVNPIGKETYYSLSLKGLDRLETGGEAVASTTAFVAMWFHKDVGKAYDEGIEPAIRDAGYTPLRVDNVEHSGKIDDRIVAEIRRAHFLVCDFTCGLLSDKAAEFGQSAVARGGVYYEAGLAHGLGKTVIWTCRKDLLHHVHFDVRQYNFIVWEDGKEGEFRDALLNRIRAEIV